jgi:hypothetical protein
MAATVTVNDVLDGQVGLDVECLDRIYLNGYVPNLQVGGQVVSFMTAHLGNPIPSPAIMEKIGSVSHGGGPLRRRQPHPGGAVCQGRPQDRGDAGPIWPARRPPAAPGWPRSAPRRSSRTCSPRRNAPATTGFRGFVHQGRPAADRARPGRGLRVQALAGALCTSAPAVTGITNKSLRVLMTGLLDSIGYTTNQASYDLTRLRLNGLITRVPGKNRYWLTGDGLRFAIFYTNCTTDYHARCLPPTSPRTTTIAKRLAHHRHSHQRNH